LSRLTCASIKLGPFTPIFHVFILEGFNYLLVHVVL